MNAIVFQHGQFARLRNDLLGQAPNEAAALLLCKTAEGRDGLRLLVNEIVEVPKDAYIAQEPQYLEISPLFLAPVIKRARLGDASIILMHTHPHSDDPHFSRVDDRGEKILMPTFYRRAPSGRHGALVIGRTGFEARVTNEIGSSASIDQIIEVGSNLLILNQGKSASDVVDVRHDRNVRTFGAAGQALLQQLTIGVVGLGGTGSVVAQQLAHLGVANVLLIDHDNLEETNLNRVVGAAFSDVGDLKVNVASRHIRKINPDCSIDAISGSVVEKAIARKLLNCDFIFCCTDSHGSRAVINQLAYQYLIPTIDMGVRIDATEGRIKSMAARVQMLAPGLSCLTCQNLLDPEEVRRDFLTPFQRQADPYIQGHHEPQPAVISINTTTASMAVTMFLSAVVGIPQTARHLIYKIGEGTVRAIRASSADDCVVCSQRGALARGDSWEMAWKVM